jgi:hypothetical protein
VAGVQNGTAPGACARTRGLVPRLREPGIRARHRCFLALSVLPLAGAAVANVLLPSMTGVYATGPQDLGRPAKARSP